MEALGCQALGRRALVATGRSRAAGWQLSVHRRTLRGDIRRSVKEGVLGARLPEGPA